MKSFETVALCGETKIYLTFFTSDFGNALAPR